MDLKALKNHPVIWLIGVCVATGALVGGVVSWSYSERINKLNDQINSTTKRYELQVERLNLELSKKKNNCDERGGGVQIGGSVTQETGGNSSPNVISGGNTNITHN